MNKEKIIKDHFAALGARGGKKTWENVSAEDRKRILTERGRKGLEKRWKNKKEKVKDNANIL